jgi:UDP-glucose 4-epimerase
VSRVLVTGGCGKLGRWVVRELAGLTGSDAGGGHDLTVLDTEIREPVDGVRYVVGDILDLDGLTAAMRGMDVVVHLAAIPRPGVVSEADTFRINVLGTFNVHEAALACGVAKVVSTSSVAVLGWTYRDRDFELDYVPVDEDHPVHPQGAYALSKLLGENIARSYSERSELCTVVLRPNWIAEPEELARVQEQGGRPVTAYDTFTYVDVRDLAVAYRLAVEKPLTGHHLVYTNADDSAIAEPLAEAMGRVAPSVSRLEGLEGAGALISNARAQRVLGWVPRHTWREAGRPQASRAGGVDL